MSRLVSRILLSIFMFPLAGLFYMIVLIVSVNALRSASLFHPQQETMVFALCGILTWILVAAYWCLLWRSSVKWNNERITHTWLATGGALLVASIAGFVGGAIMPSRDSATFGTLIAGVLAILLWLIATVFIWRETAAERAERIAGSSGSAIACPICGYNLTGLTESRCPECGSKFTLDELLASQPNNKVEIE
jgi:hypothetical protein